MPHYKLAYSTKCPVKYVKLDRNYGEFYGDKVCISDKLKGRLLVDTLIHEGFHAFIAESGIVSSDEWNGMLEEFFCEMYTKFLQKNFDITPKKHLIKTDT